MSQENVEIVHRLVEAWNEGRVDTFLGFFDPDCEVAFRPEVPEPGPFRGHAELRQWAEGFMACLAVASRGGRRDAGFARYRRRLPPPGWARRRQRRRNRRDRHPPVHDSNGRIVRWQNFADHSEALEAAGLPG
jgi:hypothetical protein